MAFDYNNKTAMYFVDEFGLVMSQNRPWNPDGDFGEGDCIGRTFDGLVAWENHETFTEEHKEIFTAAIKSCFVMKEDHKGKYMVGYRHPNRLDDEYNDMSRDHILYALMYMKYTNDPFLKDMIKYLRWRISDRFTFTPDSWAWMKALNGNVFWTIIFYLMAIPVMAISVLWNKLVYKIAGFKEESHQDDFILIPNSEMPEKKKKWRGRLYPIYAMFQAADQLSVLPDNFGNRIMKRITLWGTPKHNYAMKLMLDGDVTEEQVLGYKPMTGGRWSTVLNEVNDRDVRFVTKPEHLEANVMDVDFLIALWEKRNK